MATRLGYKPNAMAKALAHRRRADNQTEVRAELGWLNLWPEAEKLRTYSEFNAYWKGAYAAAERGGYRLVEFTGKRDGSLNRIQDIMVARGIAGLLVPPHVIKIDWSGFRWDDFIVVKFGYSNPDLRVHMCGSDQHHSALLATRKIVEHGYRRVGFVTASAGPKRTKFIAGFLHGQFNLGLPVVPPLLLDSPITARERTVLKTWLRRHRVDAILTDLGEARSELEKIGLRVPDDLGLAVLSVLDGNADSGIDQNSFEIGQAAVDLLISLIHSGQHGIPGVCRQVLVEGKWVDGTSVLNLGTPEAAL